jgi:hypothetical protein
MPMIFAFIFGIIAAVIAASKGRSVIGWFLIGFFFSVFGVIIALCVSDLNAEQMYRDGQDQENRRLREKLKQEQMKLERLRQSTESRLDAHDTALNMNTRAPASLRYGSSAPALPASNGQLQWYYAMGASQFGPVAEEEIGQLIEHGNLNEATLLWKEGMSQWITAKYAAEFAHLFL